MRRFTPDPDSFLRRSRGVVHVGANVGQERDVYAAHGLKVLWIEPIPEIYERLCQTIASYPKQRALKYLVTDQDDKEYALHVSSNEGMSSSILDLEQHKKLWPDVSFTKDILIRSVRLSTLVKREQIDLALYETLVLDTQGSEMLVLKGAVDIFPAFRFIKTEVADFESYKGCCQLPEVDKFLGLHGFRRLAKRKFAAKAEVGAYFDVLYGHAVPLLPGNGPGP